MLQKKYFRAFGLSINDVTARGVVKGFVTSVKCEKEGGELYKITLRHFQTTPFSIAPGPVIKNFIQLQVPNFQLSSPKLLNKDSY